MCAMCCKCVECAMMCVSCKKWIEVLSICALCFGEGGVWLLATRQYHMDCDEMFQAIVCLPSHKKPKIGWVCGQTALCAIEI